MHCDKSGPVGTLSRDTYSSPSTSRSIRGRGSGVTSGVLFRTSSRHIHITPNIVVLDVSPRGGSESSTTDTGGFQGHKGGGH